MTRDQGAADRPEAATGTPLAEEVARLAREVALLRDREAIRDRLDAYAGLLDAGRYAEVPGEVFAPDAVNHHLPSMGEAGVLRGRAQIADYFASRMPAFAGTQHLIGNIAISVDGDTADSRAYALASHWRAGSDHCDLAVSVIYVDSWVRTAAGWRIRERRVYACGPHGRVVGTGDLPPLTPSTDLFGPRAAGAGTRGGAAAL